MAMESIPKGETFELENLKKEVQKLSDELKDMLHAAGTQGKEKLMEHKKRMESALRMMRGEMRDRLGDTKEKLDELYENCCDYSKEAVDVSRNKIVEKPLTAVLSALGIGILFGILLGRR